MDDNHRQFKYKNEVIEINDSGVTIIEYSFTYRTCIIAFKKFYVLVFFGSLGRFKEGKWI